MSDDVDPDAKAFFQGVLCALGLELTFGVVIGALIFLVFA